MSGTMIIGKDNYYSLDTHKTYRNNNVLVVGASGAGKTRGIVSPNLLMAEGSYIVTDPKGNLYDKYGDYLRKKGYVVKRLDFSNPSRSVRYNPFEYIREPNDIAKIAYMLVYGDNRKSKSVDPFWDEAASILVSSLIAFLLEDQKKEYQTLNQIASLIPLGRRDEDSSSSQSPLDRIFARHRNNYPSSWACEQYDFVATAPCRTFNSILISLVSKFSGFNSRDMKEFLSVDEVDIPSIGQKKTALFVVVSDTDRSKDTLANLFFTQAMSELCRYADEECADNRLPVPVRFFMDDFATNCTIYDFPRMIASIRSREISATLMIQAESQLTAMFGDDGRTIVGNCDTYVYLGGNDVETARNISQRYDIGLKKMLELEQGNIYIFRRGEKSLSCTNVDLDEFEKTMDYEKPRLKKTVKEKNRESLSEVLRGQQRSRPALSSRRKEKEYEDDGWLFA